MRALLLVSILAACGDRRPPTKPPAEPALPDAPVVVDARVAEMFSLDAAPDAPPARTEYRVRISNPNRVVTNAHDAACGPVHASCKPGTCFVPTAQIDKPASKPAMVACTRDSECTVKRTDCCQPSKVDIRAIRSDQVADLRRFVCPRGSKSCGLPDPDVTEIPTFTAGCVENKCQMLTPIQPEWCEPDRDIHYRIAMRDGSVITRERTLECFGISRAPACRTDESCYRELAPEAPRPPVAARACKRDADCFLTFVGCCACGATVFRAVNASSTWQTCPTRAAVCPPCSKTTLPFPENIPASLAPACINGSCEAVEVADAQACAK